MIDFGKWAFANRKLVYFVVAVLLVGGILSAYDMSKLEDPEIKVKLAMVIATRPGASAHEMELEVTDPLEKNIRTMGEVESVTSSSFNDLAILEVELKSTVRDADVEQCWDMLRRKASDVQRRLPSGTSVVVQDDFGLVYGMLYALTGDGLTERQLSDYAGLLKRELGDLDGVARVEIYGEREECIDISILPEKMAMLGVSPAEALATLNGQNNVYYAGYYDNGPDRIRVAVADKFRAVKEIESMVIQGHEDDQLRLCDIARVEHGYAEPVRNEMSYEGQRALGIAVAAASGSDIVKVGAEVERCLAELQAERFPAGVACHKIFYQPERVKDALGTFLINLIESVVIVVAILMLTMGFRSGMIIGISLVVTVVGSFLILGMADGTMQRVSLAAFILAMGMLVDNAIVIVDGILIDLKLGKPRREADDGHRPEDGDAAAGCDADRHPFVPADLPLARYGGCLRARSVHRAGRVAAAELGAGAGACAAHGRRMARSVCCSGRRRDALRQCCLPLVACGARLRPAASLVVDRRGARAGGAERLGLRLHASGLLPRYGLRPALYGVQTARGDEFDPREGRFGGDPPLFEEPSGDPLGGRFDRRHAGALQSGAQHRHAVAFVRRADYRFRVSGGAGTQYRRHPADAFGSLSRCLRQVEALQPDVQEVPDRGAVHGARSGRAAPVGRQCALHHGAHARGVSDYDRLGARAFRC